MLDDNWDRTAHSDWTDPRIAKLKQLWADGATASNIAAEIGGFENCRDGGRSAVLGKVRRLGLPMREPGSNQHTERASRPKPQMSNHVAAAIAKKLSAKTTTKTRELEPKRVASTLMHRKARDPFSDTGAEIKELPADQSPDAVKFLDRVAHRCAWPLNEVVPITEHLSCGSPVHGEHSYCARHLRVSTNPRLCLAPLDNDPGINAMKRRANRAAYNERLARA